MHPILALQNLQPELQHGPETETTLSQSSASYTGCIDQLADIGEA